MNGFSLTNSVRIVAIAAVALAIISVNHAEGDDPAPESAQASKTVDPFIEQARAKEMLIGIWQYSANFTQWRPATTYTRDHGGTLPYPQTGSNSPYTPGYYNAYNAPQQPRYSPDAGDSPSSTKPSELPSALPSADEPTESAPSRDQQENKPAGQDTPRPSYAAQPSGPSVASPYGPPQPSEPEHDTRQAPTTKSRPVAEQTAKRELSSSFRLDLKKDNAFRMEALFADHKDKSCDYVFIEGKWDLRGRLLVLSSSVDGIVHHWVFLIERLSDNEADVRGVEEPAQLLAEGRGTIQKPETPTAFAIPKGYEVDVEIANFDPLSEAPVRTQNALQRLFNELE